MFKVIALMADVTNSIINNLHSNWPQKHKIQARVNPNRRHENGQYCHVIVDIRSIPNCPEVVGENGQFVTTYWANNR